MSARDYSLNTVLPAPTVRTVDERGELTPPWRLAFEAAFTALFGETGDADVTKDIPTGSYVGSVAGDPSKGLTVSGTPGSGYTATLSLSRSIIADGAKLDTVETGATADQTAAEIRALVEAATDSNVFTDADHTKLNGIASGATANATDAQLRDRATHTGAQAISTITGLQAALDGKVGAASITAIATDMSSDAFADELKAKINEIITALA